ncbi:hypothetical protein ASF57_12040 [Methylobacterium sp. Leaf117]|nr:hypothetical protein ASF57_12040 [Methylobacterium sp. Leaf117]
MAVLGLRRPLRLQALGLRGRKEGTSAGGGTLPPIPSAPDAPTLAVSTSGTTVTVAWIDGSGNGAPITAHKLYRGTVSGTRVLIGTISTASPYQDLNRTPGETLYYSLSAVNSAGESAQSAQKSITLAAAATVVVPVTDWRVPLSSAVATGYTSQDPSPALLASPANKDLVTVSTLANTPVVIEWTLSSGIASPGGLLWFTTTSGVTANRTVAFDYTTDSGATYTAIPGLSFDTVPSTTGNPTPTRYADQLIDLPSMPANARLRMTYTSTTAHAFKVMGPVQRQTDPLRNPIFGVASMSIGINAMGIGQLYEEARKAYPGGDPIFYVRARSGAKPADMLTEQLQTFFDGLAPYPARPYIKRFIVDFGVNEFLGNGNWDGLNQAGKDRIKADGEAIVSWASARGHKLQLLAPNFVNPTNFDSGSATGILQENVVDGPNVSITNQNLGNRFYNINAYYPTIRTVDGSWNAKYQAAQYDGYTAFLNSWDWIKQVLPGMTLQDGTHPLYLATALYRYPVMDAYAYATGFGAPAPLFERIIAASEPMATQAQKDRLYLMLASLPDTTDTGALSARAALKTRVDNLVTTFAEASGQVQPGAWPGAVASFDFNDQSTIFVDDSATRNSKMNELARVVQGKSPNAFKVINSVATTVPYKQTQFVVGLQPGQKGVTGDGLNQYLENTTDAAFYGAINAAAQPFIISWVDYVSAGSTASSLKVIWQFLGGTGALLARYAASSTKLAIVGTSVIGTEATDATLNAWHSYVLTYDGTTLRLLRDGIETISAAWSKPAQTHTAVRPLQTGFQGIRKSWHLHSGVWTTGTRDGIIGRLKADAARGNSGATASTSPTGTVSLLMLNNQPQDSMTVETWRGRHLAMVSTTIPNATISVSDPNAQFSVQGKRGEPYLLQQWNRDVGAIGSTRSMTLTAANGSETVTRTVAMPTVPYVFNKADWLDAFDYTAPGTFTFGSGANSSRIKTATGFLNGHVRVSPAGDGAEPGTTAPTFDTSTNRMRLTKSASQYLKLSTDAKNDDWRALTGARKSTYTHIVIAIPVTLDVDANTPLVSYSDAGGFTKTALRMVPKADGSHPVSTMRQAGGVNSFAADMGQSMLNTEGLIAVGTPFMATTVMNGEMTWNAIWDRRPAEPVKNDYADAVIVECELGRMGTAYSDMIVLWEGIKKDDICPSELRAILAGIRFQNPGMGLPNVPDYRVPLDMSGVDAPRWKAEDTNWDFSPSYEADVSLPGAWSFNHDNANLLGTTAANGTEVAYHMDLRSSTYLASGLNLQERLPGNILRESAIPISTAPIPQAAKDYITGLPREGGVTYTHLGAYRMTRNWQSYIYGMPEVVGKNPKSRTGVFACMMWDVADAGGHPPETDVMEQDGPKGRISTGVHQNARWPIGGTRRAISQVSFGPSATDKEFHSYQCIKDAASDTWVYAQDGWVIYVQEAQKGLRINSVKAWRAALKANSPAGIRGSGIVLPTGQTSGAIRLSLVNAGGGVPATFMGLVTNGELVDIAYDNDPNVPTTPLSSSALAFMPGNYKDDSALTLKLATGAAINCTTVPDASLVSVGINDPRFYDGFHTGMYLIANMAMGGASFAGIPDPNISADLFVSNMRISPMKRAPANITTTIQTRANSHCTDLFAAIAARGSAVPDADKALFATMISNMMALERRWDREMDGSDQKWDRVNAKSIWDGIGQFYLSVGPWSDLVDIKDPSSIFTVSGDPVKSNDKGRTFDGRAGGGQLIDTVKNLRTNNALANLFRNDDNGFSVILSDNAMTGSAAMAPIVGAGATVQLAIGGPSLTRALTVKDITTTVSRSVPDCFNVRQGHAMDSIADLGRVFMQPGFYSSSRDEARYEVRKNGIRNAAYYGSYFTGRDYINGHSGGVTPTESFKIGSHSAGVQGATASVAGALTHRGWKEEEVAEAYRLMKPLLQKWAVPGHAA